MTKTQDLLKLKIDYEPNPDLGSWIAYAKVTCGEHTLSLSEWVNADGTLEEVDSLIKTNMVAELEEFGTKTREQLGFPPHDGCGNWDPVADLVVELFRAEVEAEFAANAELMEMCKAFSYRARQANKMTGPTFEQKQELQQLAEKQAMAIEAEA